MGKPYILNSTLWPAFTVVPFKFFQYLVTIEFTCDTSTLWHSNLNCWPLEENGIHNLLNTHCPLGNTRSLGIFQCPNFIFNFSPWFIKMNAGFIVCYYISNLSFVKIWIKFQYFLSICYTCPILVV